MSNITMKDIAQHAGVSVATVSRVINKDPSVKSQNVEKVMQAIKKYDFVPNSVARSLKCSRSKTIGFLVSDIANYHFVSMAKVIETAARKRGYDMLICSTDENKTQELGHLQRFLSNQVDGIILNTTNQNNEYIAQLSHQIPIVLIDRKISSPAFKGDFVGSDNYSSILQMTQYLLKIGHRRIGIINSELAVNTGEERMAGFVQAMELAGITIDKNYPYQHESPLFNFEGGYDGAQKLMALSPPPTALIVTNNMMALGALSYLKSQNIKIPEKISFFSYGNISNSELFFLDLSYAVLNPYSMGKRAAEFILSRIEHPEMSNREAIFESQLSIGNSICPTH